MKPGSSLKQSPTFWRRADVLTAAAAIASLLIALGLRLLGYDQSHRFAIGYLPLWLVIVGGGIPLVIEIIRTIFDGEFGTDVLAAVSVVVAVILGEYYAAVLVILMLSGGQALESFAMRKASSVLHALARRMPALAHKRINGQLSEIPISQIAIGDEIAVLPHETCPVDGVVVDGNGTMDESYLTGEPYDVNKAPGTTVLSGAINGEALLIVRAEKVAADSRYAQIMRVMEDAVQRRPRLRRLGEMLGSWFTPLVLIVAGIAWWLTGDATRFLSVLVIATPCPLLIAIPITIISAISLAARRGIIIKDPVIIERLPTCRIAIFDKTGTLTYGRPELVAIHTAGGRSEAEVLALAASVERYSKHPLAHAILKAAESKGIALPTTTAVAERPGQGLTGEVNGATIVVTSRAKLTTLDPAASSHLPPTAPGMESMLAIDGCYAATFQFRDVPREEGKSFISHLSPNHQFRRVVLLSGDRESEVRYLADTLKISELYASQSPEQKVEVVRNAVASEPTLFMGDGINDAPALATATVGIAFGSANAVTSESAGAVILDSTLVKVDELLHISATTRAIALQSALGGMALSLIGIGFAAAGAITPVAGALIQEGIDVVAILNALRLTFNRKIETDM